jgi:pilus assembly protein Flp/PilA
MKNQKHGQAISEYLILTALIAVGSIAMIQILGSNIQKRIAVVSEAIRGNKKELQGTEAKEKHYKIRDLGDFQQGMQDSGSDK